jgi:hypothetical protein
MSLRILRNAVAGFNGKNAFESFKTTENTEKPFKLSIPICNDRK